ncbi:MAG: FxLYD domain-containing protein [Bacillota bacterium]
MEKCIWILLIVVLVSSSASALQFHYDKPIYSYPGGQKIGVFYSGTLIDNYPIIDSQDDWICINFRDGRYSIKGWINKSETEKKIDLSDMFEIESIKFIDEEYPYENSVKMVGEIKNNSQRDFPGGVIIKISLYDYFGDILGVTDIVITHWPAGATKTFSERIKLIRDNKDADDISEYKIQYETGV